MGLKSVSVTSWLQSRLTPAKSENPRWVGLAKALETIWDGDFIPYLSRYQRLRSSFEADDADLAKQIAQMGDYFSYEFPKPQDRAISLAWRRLELEYKDVEAILTMALRRHFGSIQIDWFPEYNPVDKTYGEGLIPFDQLRPKSEKNVPLDGYFLTSRGVVAVDKQTLYKQQYYRKETIREDMLAVIKRIKPIDRIFDYLLWYQEFILPFEKPDFTVFWEVDQELPFLFDTVKADANNDLSVTSEVERTCNVDFLPAWNESLYWHLDMFPREGWYPIDDFPEIGFMPVMTWPFYLDKTFAGQEGMTISPLGICIAERQKRPPVYFLPPQLEEVQAESESSVPLECSASCTVEMEAESTFALPYVETFRGLDRGPYYYDIEADFMPLDYPTGGYLNVI